MRQLIADYRATIDRLLPQLDADNFAIAVKIARSPDLIRGYGPVKEQAIAEADAIQAKLLSRFARPGSHAVKLGAAWPDGYIDRLRR